MERSGVPEAWGLESGARPLDTDLPEGDDHEEAHPHDRWPRPPAPPRRLHPVGLQPPTRADQPLRPLNLGARPAVRPPPLRHRARWVTRGSRAVPRLRPRRRARRITAASSSRLARGEAARRPQPGQVLGLEYGLTQGSPTAATCRGALGLHGAGEHRRVRTAAEWSSTTAPCRSAARVVNVAVIAGTVRYGVTPSHQKSTGRARSRHPAQDRSQVVALEVARAWATRAGDRRCRRPRAARASRHGWPGGRPRRPAARRTGLR